MYKKITNYLNSCIEKDALSHAYIFSGPDEITRNQVALWFANKILNNENQKLLHGREMWHPDLLLLKSNANEEIIMDIIENQLKKFLILTPHCAAYKVALIENGEHLNDRAQTMLLKIFEEAPKHAVIIICVKTPDSLFETTVSRAVKISFWKQEKSEITPKKIAEIFENLIIGSLSDRYRLVERLSVNYEPKDAFKKWLNFLRIKFLKNPEKLLEILKTSQNIYFKLNETYFNPKLAYDELILNLETDITD